MANNFYKSNMLLKGFSMSQSSPLYDVAIIGSGPAGLTAGIYASRAKLNTVIIQGPVPGGQLTTTTKVENWPGNISILGPDLMENMMKHAQACGSTMLMDTITSVNFSQKPFSLTTEQGTIINARSVIVATGASNRKLEVPGEQQYFAKGVSTCATCDAPFYQDKEVIVVGGGDSAMIEADHISHFAKKVTIIHILDQLTGKDPIKFDIMKNPKITILYSSTVVEIKGDGEKVTNVVVQSQKDKKQTTIATNGVFIAIGLNPNTDLFKNQLTIDAHGFLVVNNHTKTNIEGVFAAGDVSDYRYRQAITSAGVGCMAALDAQTFLSTKQING